jgi:hypothetical protein
MPIPAMGRALSSGSVRYTRMVYSRQWRTAPSKAAGSNSAPPSRVV